MENLKMTLYGALIIALSILSLNIFSEYKEWVKEQKEIERQRVIKQAEIEHKRQLIQKDIDYFNKLLSLDKLK